jgi:M6 family metalloprotease-like protein
MSNNRIRSFSPRYFGWLSSLLLYQSSVHGFVPPHPDSDLAETFEPVFAKRRRLQRSYNYTPSFIHPEICRNMNEEECQDVDESLQDHARRHRQLWEDRRDFDDHLDETSGFSTLLNHLEYPQTEPTYRQSKDTPVQPTPRRNPYIVGKEEPNINILILLMRFQDHKGRILPDKAEYAKLWNERIHHWFELNSFGNYRYQATVTDWMDTDDTELAYAAGVSGLRYSLQESIWPLLDRLNEDPSFDFSKFDSNKDGKLDAVVILHSGYPAEVGGRDCSNQRPPEDRIWSHAFASSKTWTTLGIIGTEDYSYNLERYEQLREQLLQTQQEAQQQQQQQQNSQQEGDMGGQGFAPPEQNVDGPPANSFPLEPVYSLHGYLFASGLDVTCGSNVAKMGVMVHEYMHTLGLDDVYDYGTDSPGKGIGIWDLMGYPYGAQNDEDYPGHLSAYSKYSLGWITPMQWKPEQGSQLYAINPAETSPHAIKIVLSDGPQTYTGQADTLPAPSSRLMPQYQDQTGNQEEYLLLEFRKALEFDRDLGDRTGLIIYHVDESVARMNNRGYPGQVGWPENGNHYRVAVLPADTLYHLERGVNKGDSGDAWPQGSMLGPGRARIQRTQESPKREFGDPEVTYPNTDTYRGGVIEETGIYVQNVLEREENVTIRLSWQDGESGTFHFSTTIAPPPEEQTVTTRTGFTAPDCINLWSWVDLEVEPADGNGESSTESIHCTDIAKDPDAYCDRRDVSCGWSVWEICRKECPYSDCYP